MESTKTTTIAMGRSREGAWIEILLSTACSPRNAVAPVRERGLKLALSHMHFRCHCRSREGAWIEIDNTGYTRQVPRRRSREGAWIEILNTV